jgi:hypothetical protein
MTEPIYSQLTDTCGHLIGRNIATIEIPPDHDWRIDIMFVDGSQLRLVMMSECCKERFFRSDDDAHQFVGAIYNGVEIKRAEYVDDQEYEVHEIAFLEVNTSVGPMTFAAHNIHNGYYAGFDIEIEEVKREAD